MGLTNKSNPRRALAAAALGVALACAATPASAQTIIDEWTTIKAPPRPALQSVKLDPKTTALLVLDIVKQTCTPRPRCLASLPKVAELLKQARAHGMLVVYSVILANKGTEAVLPAVAPLGTEPVVKSGPDKFLGTDLDQVLKAHGITTVIPVGTRAEGAVLYTGSHAALLGYKVVLPVDGMSSDTLYPEQYVTWNMANAPAVGTRVTLTSIDRITF